MYDLRQEPSVVPSEYETYLQRAHLLKRHISFASTTWHDHLTLVLSFRWT